MNTRPDKTNGWSETFNPQLSTPNPQPSTLNPEPSSINPEGWIGELRTRSLSKRWRVLEIWVFGAAGMHCTLHPAPCTLHPAPCILHPAPCALHPAPCTCWVHRCIRATAAGLGTHRCMRAWVLASIFPRSSTELNISGFGEYYLNSGGRGVGGTGLLPWREASSPNRHDDIVDSDQQVVNKELSLLGGTWARVPSNFTVSCHKFKLTGLWLNEIERNHLINTLCETRLGGHPGPERSCRAAAPGASPHILISCASGLIIHIEGTRCRENMAHVRQSRPGSGLDFLAEVLEIF